MDMAGNVLEFVNDWYQYDYYSVSPVDNPQGPTTGIDKSFRGGSWSGSFSSLLVAARRNREPTEHALNTGFRCAESP
jgi:formylglycine-generating enzyme required for sulfatase activity